VQNRNRRETCLAWRAVWGAVPNGHHARWAGDAKCASLCAETQCITTQLSCSSDIVLRLQVAAKALQEGQPPQCNLWNTFPFLGSLSLLPALLFLGLGSCSVDTSLKYRLLSPPRIFQVFQSGDQNKQVGLDWVRGNVYTTV